MVLQKTIQSVVEIQGVGLHSGKKANLRIRPAAPNTGIVFVRTDIENCPEIPALYENVIDTRLQTTLGKNGVTIATVEHLLAAIKGLGLDNALIEVDGPEVPILDGSSAPFCEMIEAVGLEKQIQARKVLKIRRRVEVQLAEKWAYVEPSEEFAIHATIEWEHPVIGYQEFQFLEGRNHFREIAASRTFGLLQDVNKLRQAGYGLGGSLDNCVVLSDSGVLNAGGLRYPDEFVRHKVLDAMGDFQLAGIEIQGLFRLHRSGHDLHAQLVREIFSDSRNYVIVDAPAGAQGDSEDLATGLDLAVAY